jgi:ferredoxin-NADP reductase
MLEAVSGLPFEAARAFVCGPTSFVESVATLLVDLGHDPAQVRTERFGPTS